MALNEEQFYDFSTSYFNTYEYYTVVTLDDEGELTLDDNQYYGLGNLEYSSDIKQSSYTLTTAGKLNLGLAYFFGKNGFITGDIELRDYSSLYLNGNDFDLSMDNQVIKERYTSVLNYRIGAEYKLGSFQFRGGYGFQEDPYASSNGDRDLDQYSLGFGYREADFFIDFALTQQRIKNFISPYEIEVNQPVARLCQYPRCRCSIPGMPTNFRTDASWH